MTDHAPRRSAIPVHPPIPPAPIGPIPGSESRSGLRNRPFVALSDAENARRFKELKGQVVLGIAGEAGDPGAT
ncbi:MAG TPA: hypothetical protein VFV02_04550 [Acidimicrobiales bacterium]|nr:hypothetical protein [Acidimicrobiales bacterium]